MESIKTCNVCYLSYDTKDHTPRSLPCGHTLCSKCLVTMLNIPTLRKCPFDKIAFPPSQNSLVLFPPNYAIRDVLEQKNNNACKIHPGERLKLICLTENKKICCECAKHEEHQGHKIKKIKGLKVQGAKMKEELQEILGSIKDYEQEKAEDFEQVRKVFIHAIDEQVKEVKTILVEKQFEWAQQVNNILNAEKKNVSEDLFTLKQQMNESLKNITDLSQDENGDLLILDRETQNDLRRTKGQIELLKEKSSRVQTKFIEMQKSLKESLRNSMLGINSLSLTSQDVVQEIYSVPREEELMKIHKKLRSLKFMSHCEIEIDSGCLKISFKNARQKAIEINLDDFQAIEKVDIQLLRCDMLKNERHPDVLSYVFHGLKKLVNLTVSFDPKYFDNKGFLWLRSKIQIHALSLKRVSFNLENCIFDNRSMPILCDMIFSKTINLDSLALNLDSCQTIDGDLKILANSIQPLYKNLKILALGFNNSQMTDDEVYQAFEIIKRMESLKELQFYFSRTKITNESFKIFGENVLPYLKNLENLALSFDESEKISDEGFCIMLKNLPNLKRLDLNLSNTLVTDKAVEMFIGEVLPRLESLKYLSWRAQGTKISKENIEKIGEIGVSFREKKEQGVKMEIEKSSSFGLGKRFLEFLFFGVYGWFNKKIV